MLYGTVKQAEISVQMEMAVLTLCCGHMSKRALEFLGLSAQMITRQLPIVYTICRQNSQLSTRICRPKDNGCNGEDLGADRFFRILNYEEHEEHEDLFLKFSCSSCSSWLKSGLEFRQ